jgi:exonuclease SbcC
MASGAGLPLHSAVLYASYVLAGLLVMLWVWLALLRLDTHRRRSRARRLSQALETIEALEPAPGAVRGEGSPDLAEVALPGAEAAVVDKPDDERRARLQRRILALEASEQEVRAAVGHEAAWMRRRVARLGARRAAGLEELDRARADGLRRGDLQRRREELEDELAEHRRQKALRRLACRLLDGSARAVSERFSDHLRGMVSRALPQFTEGRYDYLEVDEAFQVRVYSSDKRNLLDLDEISSGTQRQILLALRLGLSQELVTRLVKDDQFTFLDEPFAFFDSTRMRGALKTLLELGGDVVQYWVVAQRFPQDTHIGIEIPCGRHPDTLEVGRPEMD